MSEPVMKWEISIIIDGIDVTQFEAVLDTDAELWKVMNLTAPSDLDFSKLADIWLVSSNMCRGVSNGLMADIEAGKEVHNAD